VKDDWLWAGFGLESARILKPKSARSPLASAFDIWLPGDNSNCHEFLQSFAVTYNQGRAVKLNQMLALKFA
jgi:hypothetical protein